MHFFTFAPAEHITGTGADVPANVPVICDTNTYGNVLRIWHISLIKMTPAKILLIILIAIIHNNYTFFKVSVY